MPAIAAATISSRLNAPGTIAAQVGLARLPIEERLHSWIDPLRPRWRKRLLGKLAEPA